MRSSFARRARFARFACLAALLAAACAAGCDTAPRLIQLPPLKAPPDAGPPPFSCSKRGSETCLGTVHYGCKENGEFLDVVTVDCAKKGMVCDPVEQCIVCHVGEVRCKTCDASDVSDAKDTGCDVNTVQRCVGVDGASDDASTAGVWADVQTCDLRKSLVCDGGRCVNSCDLADTRRSYVGCNFFAADLDNAAIDDMNNASAQQYAVAVANPQSVPVQVRVERNDGAFGAPAKISVVQTKTVPPGDLEVFKLPRRELDGSSATGINDGTHTAVSSNAYHIVSTHPVTAYQFNPLENVNVFSNDASLLLPTSALGKSYTVVAWPQTIGNSKNPEDDFDHTSSDEDLRAFLTIIGTAQNTHVTMKLGTAVMAVVGAGPVPATGPNGTIDLDIKPFDVINLETAHLNADFSGTLVTSTQPVAVFVGSEASDAPKFESYETRLCCADHLEEQLIPDSAAGSHFVVARTPSRTKALNAAAPPGMSIGVSEINEPEWVRIVGIDEGDTTVITSLPAPNDTFVIHQHDSPILRADRDFVIDADHRIAVLQIMGSQGVTGIPKQYPGGDPSIITVPPVEQFRRDYIFLTPDKYAFDFVVIVARPDASILLDGAPLPTDTCTTEPIINSGTDGGTVNVMDVQWVAHRCQLAFPIVTPGLASKILPGVQHDGVHTLVSNREMGIVVEGFDRFVSYAYVGGLNLDVLD